jgi:NAD(P)-dependent dehydrogenase (short-subunit alcohol dehydrogenase family)
MGNRLHGKVCIVTGAGSGMGRACAIEMAAQGRVCRH